MAADFHTRVVAASTRNPAVEMLVLSVHGQLLLPLDEGQMTEPFLDPRGPLEHLAFVHAVGRRELAEAESILRTHIDCTAVHVAT